MTDRAVPRLHRTTDLITETTVTTEVRTTEADRDLRDRMTVLRPDPITDSRAAHRAADALITDLTTEITVTTEAPSPETTNSADRTSARMRARLLLIPSSRQSLSYAVLPLPARKSREELHVWSIQEARA